jgi:creatinine deaminase
MTLVSRTPAEPVLPLQASDAHFLKLALEQALKSYREGGLPIGAVLARDGEVVATGHNRRVQDGDPIAHGEMDCLRRAGRQASYAGMTLITTLSPCMMCAGAILQFGIPRVVVGEDQNFPGNVSFLRSHGVQVIVVEDDDCIELMRRFIAEQPTLWNEDIAGRTSV